MTFSFSFVTVCPCQILFLRLCLFQDERFFDVSEYTAHNNVRLVNVIVTPHFLNRFKLSRVGIKNFLNVSIVKLCETFFTNHCKTFPLHDIRIFSIHRRIFHTSIRVKGTQTSSVPAEIFLAVRLRFASPDAKQLDRNRLSMGPSTIFTV